MCRVVSILTHFFFTACFAFLFLESLHMYSILARVVKKDGMLTKTQNVVVGWGMSLAVILIVCSFHLDQYGGSYHCMLQTDKMLVYGQLIPITTLLFLTLTLIEAAGAGHKYVKLPGADDEQYLSGKG